MREPKDYPNHRIFLPKNKLEIKINELEKVFPSLVWSLYDKRMKRLKFLNQPIVEDYRDFDVVFHKIKGLNRNE